MNVANNLARGVPKHARLRLDDIIPGDWADQAACVGADTDLWFREAHDTTSYREARTFCARCPVTTQCLEWALLTHTEHGVFGGLTPRERKNLVRGIAT